jgi:acylphosphatase
MRRRLTAQISGAIQGKGFRYFVLKTARKLNMISFAQNLNDGGVKVVAEGDEYSLEKMLVRICAGPPGALVNEVVVKWSDAKQRLRRPF